MSEQYFTRIFKTIALTILTTIWTLTVFLYHYVKNPFGDPFAKKLRLLPPAAFTDTKYGLHHYVKINGTRIHYMESGDPSKPLIIFLHGFPEFWYSWRYQITEFKKDYWCVAVDLRGFGDSEKTEGVANYKLDVLVQDIRLLLEYLGHQKCIIISHDFGGMIACRLRDKHPDILTAVVLLSSTSIEALFTGIWNNWNQLIKSWQIFLFNLPWIPEKWILLKDMVFFEKLMLSSGKKRITNNDVECYKYWSGKPSALFASVNIFKANFMLSCEKKEVKGNVPMFAMIASNDHLLETSLLRNMKEEYLNLETKVLNDAGHCIQQEEPEEVNRLIKEFLNKHKVCES